MQKNPQNSYKIQRKQGTAASKSVFSTGKFSIDRKIQPCYANCTKTPNTVDTPVKQEVRYGIFYGVYSGHRRICADRGTFIGYVFKEVSV